jgi:hypothetical protein
MDVSYDDQDEAIQMLNEDELRVLQKVNSIQCTEGMRILPKEVSRFDIPLCRMVYMPLVRPTLANDIKRLEAEFTHGYRPGSAVFYVSICNKVGEERLVSEEEKAHWGPHRMFFICDGNHRFMAWTGYIKRLHKDDRDWHYSVDSICLDTKGKGGLLLNAMHDINK